MLNTKVIFSLIKILVVVDPPWMLLVYHNQHIEVYSALDMKDIQVEHQKISIMSENLYKICRS